MLRTKTLLVLLGFVSLTVREGRAANQDCMDVPTEHNYQIDELEGEWYPMEIMLHRNDSKIYGVPVDTKCPMVTFSKKGNSRTAVIMLWNSTEGDMKYTFTSTQKTKGQWQTTPDQTGSLVNDQYKQYRGIVKVVKLDGDILFLSFCSRNFQLLTTVAFSREENMPADVFEDTLAVLNNKHQKRARVISRDCKDDDDDGSGSQKTYASNLLLLCILLGMGFGQ